MYYLIHRNVDGAGLMGEHYATLAEAKAAADAHQRQSDATGNPWGYAYSVHCSGRDGAVYRTAPAPAPTCDGCNDSGRGPDGDWCTCIDLAAPHTHTCGCCDQPWGCGGDGRGCPDGPRAFCPRCCRADCISKLPGTRHLDPGARPPAPEPTNEAPGPGEGYSLDDAAIRDAARALGITSYRLLHHPQGYRYRLQGPRCKMYARTPAEARYLLDSHATQEATSQRALLPILGGSDEADAAQLAETWAKKWADTEVQRVVLALALERIALGCDYPTGIQAAPEFYAAINWSSDIAREALAQVGIAIGTVENAADEPSE